MSKNGWADRAEVVVLTPEYESWAWSDSTAVDEVLGWEGRAPDLRAWLIEKGFLAQRTAKPARPKEALEAALLEVQIRRSPSIYRQLAEKVSLDRCADSGFARFLAVLRRWFGPPAPPAPSPPGGDKSSA